MKKKHLIVCILIFKITLQCYESKHYFEIRNLEYNIIIIHLVILITSEIEIVEKTGGLRTQQIGQKKKVA